MFTEIDSLDPCWNLLYRFASARNTIDEIEDQTSQYRIKSSTWGGRISAVDYPKILETLKSQWEEAKRRTEEVKDAKA